MDSLDKKLGIEPDELESPSKTIEETNQSEVQTQKSFKSRSMSNKKVPKRSMNEEAEIKRRLEL